MFAALALCAAGVHAQAPGPRTGPEMDRLRSMEGSWNATVKMGGQESQGRMNWRMGLGGNWLVGRFEGDYKGTRLFGQGFDTYDPMKKKYVSVWIDSMSSSPMIMEGDYDKDRNALVMEGEGPGQDGKPTKFKAVSQMKDPNNIAFKMYTIQDGKENEMMTIDYQRMMSGPTERGTRLRRRG
jgi:hypothetical protein